VDLAKAQVKWTYHDRRDPYFSCPAIAGNTVVFGGRDKRIHAADRNTGAELWTFQTHGQVDSSPVICGDKVAVGSADGKIYLLDLATGKERWSYEIGEGISGAPAVAAGLIVVGAEDGTVYAFGPRP
jgi:outer membrane protein assembly factor BamB